MTVLRTQLALCSRLSRALGVAAIVVTIGCTPKVIGPSQLPSPDGGSGDASSPPDSGGVDSGSTITPGCNGQCNAVQYTTCTCHASDPCDWAGDGYCDSNCEAVLPGAWFDDSADCGGPLDCGSDCSQGRYTTCTCDPSDPCSWVGDGYCDSSCEQVLPGAWFNDSADCGGGPTDCGTECSEGRYTTCTCATSDPCSWRGDGYCDDTYCQQVLSSHFDDSADCGSPPIGDEGFGISMVNDNLDNNDGYIMENGFSTLGYGEGFVDTNVYTSELSGYLGQELTAYYHTGHGLSGEVLTYDGGLMYYQATINVHNTIFATCLTLAQSWSSAFGATAETVLGYTDVSLDYVDDDVARTMISQLQSGYNFIQAWYLANAYEYNLSDRWAGYVREGGSIVEYSARTNNKPDGVSPMRVAGTPLDSGEKLRALPSLLDDQQSFPALAGERPLLAPAPLEGSFLRGGWERLVPGELTARQALLQASSFIDRALGGLPAGAVLQGITPVTAREESQSGSVVGYAVRFERRVDGLPVAGNRVVDHISVLVSPTGVVAWSRYWPELEPQTAVAAAVLPPSRALLSGAEELAQALKKHATLVSVRPVYGTCGAYGTSTALVPAWEYQTADGTRVVLDARDGRPLR